MVGVACGMVGVVCGGCGMWWVWHVVDVACGGCGMWWVWHMVGVAPLWYLMYVCSNHQHLVLIHVLNVGGPPPFDYQ